MMDKSKARVYCDKGQDTPSPLDDFVLSQRGHERDYADEKESADVACVCLQAKYKPKLHLGWVQCDGCNRYCHITCAGERLCDMLITFSWYVNN